jgi:uncharacterized repeat protein (TIGR01451 family)
LVVIALAMIVLCSCTTTQPEYRIAESTTIRGQSPEPASPSLGSELRFSADQPGSIIVDDQVQQPPCQTNAACSACGGGGCVCCNNTPYLGPHDEYLCDGGDFGMPAGVSADWHVHGLEPEDTIAHYDTVDGRTIITPSNKLCIYAPRFAAVRQVVDVREYDRSVAPGGALQEITPTPLADRNRANAALAEFKANVDRAKLPPSLLRERQHPGELDRDRRVEETIGSLAPYANLQVIRTGEIIGTDIVKIARSSLAAITWAGDQAAQVILDNRRAQADVSVQSPGTIYHLFLPNNPKLRLIKLASKGSAVPGEEVEFTLRFDNVGDRVIGNVTIVDNLTTRLEYVPDSQKSSVPSTFSTQANEGGSLVLRWELSEPLMPGHGGVLQFRCRVR